MANMNAISAAYARQILDYDHITGTFRWKPRPEYMFNGGKYSAANNCLKWNSRFAGTIAGSKNRGYMRISLGVGCRNYYLHRIAWLIVYGQWPDHQIDHINGDRSDNRISNLRIATPAQNSQNMAKKRSNTSGFIGVSYSKTHCKWVASITTNGEALHLGFFRTPEEAHAAYLAAKAEFHTFQTVPRDEL